MTLRYVDGFDYIGSGGTIKHMQAGGWYDRANFNPGLIGGRFGFGSALWWAGNAGAGLAAVDLVRPFGDMTGGTIGFGMYCGSGQVAPPRITFFDAVNGGDQVALQFEQLGVISAYRGGIGYLNSGGGSVGTLIGRTSPGSYLMDTWFQAEAGVAIGASGSVEVRVNKKPVIQLPTVNTVATARAKWDSIRLATGMVGFDPLRWGLDDVYVNDDQGTANNGFLGKVRVKTQFAAGVGDLTQFAIGAGGQPTNWQTVQNELLDDSAYVATPTIGNADLYQLQAILGSGQTVHGVQVRTACRQDDATALIMRNQLKIGGSIAQGADFYTDDTYAYALSIFETNPATGLALTGANLNGAQIGPKLQAYA